MLDTKLRPTSTIKSKDKSSEQSFGHVNTTNPNSYLNYHFYEISYTISEKAFKKTKICTFVVFALDALA